VSEVELLSFTREKSKVSIVITLLVSLSLLSNIYLVAEHDIARQLYQRSKAIIQKILTGDAVDPITNEPLTPQRLIRPIVYYANQTMVVDIAESRDPENTSVFPDKLVISPGEYTYRGRSYNLNREGLYRFIWPGKEKHQRIVYEDNVDALLSSLAWIASHGSSDNNKPLRELSKRAMRDKVFLTCGYLSWWAKYILKQHGITSRLVAVLSVNSDSSLSSGHAFIEVFRADLKKWVLYDLDNNSYFSSLSQGNIPLSLIEFVARVPGDGYKINSLANDSSLDVSNFMSDDGFNYNFELERIYNNIKQWYKEVAQVPLIRKGDNYYFYDRENRSAIESQQGDFKYVYVEKDLFFSTFYE